MRIWPALIDELIEHAREEAPLECCGLIGADNNGLAVEVYRATNAAQSEYRYDIDGPEQQRLEAELQADGLTLGAIYHSHTHAEPYPSPLDVMSWGYPGALCLIVALDPPRVRAYRIADEQASEVELRLLPG